MASSTPLDKPGVQIMLQFQSYMLFGKLNVICLQILTDFLVPVESAAQKGRHLDYPLYYSAILPLDGHHKHIRF